MHQDKSYLMSSGFVLRAKNTKHLWYEPVELKTVVPNVVITLSLKYTTKIKENLRKYLDNILPYNT
jgi:hypothetical protein